MKPSEAIKMFENMDENDDVILAFWDKDAFLDADDCQRYSTERWAELADIIERKMDWSHTWEQIDDMLNIYDNLT